MFEPLFEYPLTLASHREGPTADERQRFPIYRGNGGMAARNTLLRSA